MSISGTFQTMPFAELLQWIGDSRRTGTLAVTLEFEERFIRFAHGCIGAYGSDDPMARDLGRLCLRAGLVEEAGLFRALAAQARSHMPLGDVLVAEGILEAAKLEGAVRAHIEETVLGLFLWPEGRFIFSAAEPDLGEWMPPEYELDEPLDAREILMEGTRRLDEWTRIVKVLPSDEARVVALGADLSLPLLEEVAAHPEPPTLGELLAEQGDSRYAVCEQLFRGFQRGLVAFETGHAPRPTGPPVGRYSVPVEHLVHSAQALLDEGQHDEAATLLRSAVALDPFRADARALLRRTCDAQLLELYAVLPARAVPQLTVPAGRAALRATSPRDRKLIAGINGRWDVGALTLTSGLGELETLRALRRLVHAGLARLTP